MPRHLPATSAAFIARTPHAAPVYAAAARCSLIHRGRASRPGGLTRYTSAGRGTLGEPAMHCRPRSPARPPALVQWALTPRQHLPHLRTQPAIQPASAGRLEQGLEAGGACFSGLIRVAHGGGRLVVVVDTRVPKLRGRGVWGWRWEGAQLVRALPAVRAGRASERTQARCRHPASQPPTPRPPTTPHTSPMLGSRRALRGSVTNTWLMGVKPKGSTRKSLVADCGGLGRGWRVGRVEGGWRAAPQAAGGGWAGG